MFLFSNPSGPGPSGEYPGPQGRRNPALCPGGRGQREYGGPGNLGQELAAPYDSYTRTVDVERTRHGGSEAFQKLDTDPVWRDLWAGYAFSIDFREERGHAWMLSDQRETERVHKVKQPGACLHCHAATYNVYREAGKKAGVPDPKDPKDWREQLMKGFEVVCAMPYDEATKLTEHPVSCIDCHSPDDMSLRVTRPGFLNGIQSLAQSTAPLKHLPSIERWRASSKKEPYDPNKHATRQEMRSFVCGQCHVEYYFKGDGKLLTYPWHKGNKVEDMQAYYDEIGFKDWTHKTAKSPMLKAQHPEFEMWNEGIHARSGVSCADCHMPYERLGASKVSSHHVRSPLLNVSKACQTCHSIPESDLLARVNKIQDINQDLMNKAEVAVMDLIHGIEDRMQKGKTDEELVKARDFHRKAQFYLDFVSAENSMGFHAPQEASRILGESIDFARKGIMALP